MLQQEVVSKDWTCVNYIILLDLHANLPVTQNSGSQSQNQHLIIGLN